MIAWDSKDLRYVVPMFPSKLGICCTEGGKSFEEKKKETVCHRILQTVIFIHVDRMSSYKIRKVLPILTPSSPTQMDRNKKLSTSKYFMNSING